MIDITFKPLHGQTEIAIAGIVFEAGETKTFGDGSSDLTESDADVILTNPNFINTELGRNPNFTCACGKPIAAFTFDPDAGHVRTEATECGACDEPGSAEEIGDDPKAATPPAASSTPSTATAAHATIFDTDAPN